MSKSGIISWIYREWIDGKYPRYFWLKGVKNYYYRVPRKNCPKEEIVCFAAEMGARPSGYSEKSLLLLLSQGIMYERIA